MANVNSAAQKSDFLVSVENLTGELPNCGATSLIVSWMGDDLRCGQCQLKPKVEQRKVDGAEMPWRVSGVSRSQAEVLAELERREGTSGIAEKASRQD